MLINDKLFVEADSCRRIDNSIGVCETVYIQKRIDNFMVSVMVSGGKGSSLTRYISSTFLSSVVINLLEKSSDLDAAAKSLIGVINVAREGHECDMPCFTLVKVDYDSNVEIACYRMPCPICFRGGDIVVPSKTEVEYKTIFNFKTKYEKYSFIAEVEDRVVFFNNLNVGATVTSCEINYQTFWEQTTNILRHIIKENPSISSTMFVRKVILESYNYEGDFKVGGEQSCGTMYFRKPRKVLLCSGPPFDKDKDIYLAERVRGYEGATVICGGTSASIVSRELGREISVLLGRDPSGLPNASSMEGVTMITEGVLTLGRVKALLENTTEPILKGRGIDIKLSSLLLNHDVIEFLVGTRINAMHQDPNIPVELELRRNVIKYLGGLLQRKFYKEVIIKYI